MSTPNTFSTAKTAIISIATIAIAVFLAMQLTAWMSRKKQERESKRQADAAAATTAAAAADAVANNE